MFWTKYLLLGIALYIGAVEVNAQCECNVLLVCPTKVYPNKWAFWVFPSNGQKIGANQDLYLNNQGWAWGESPDYSMCGSPPPPPGYVCTIRCALPPAPPRQICNFNDKVATNLQSYSNAIARGDRTYQVFMEAPYACC